MDSSSDTHLKIYVDVTGDHRPKLHHTHTHRTVIVGVKSAAAVTATFLQAIIVKTNYYFQHC